MGVPKLILIGTGEADKATVGRSLSEKLNVPFYDADWACNELYGASLGTCVVDQDRDKAATAVKEATKLLLDTEAIVSLPSGAADNDELLRTIETNDGPLVLLIAPLADLYRQAGLNVARPIGLGPIRAVFSQMEKRITQKYLNLGPLVVDLAQLSKEEALDKIETSLALQ